MGKGSFLRGWLTYNLVGWLAGCMIIVLLVVIQIKVNEVTSTPNNPPSIVAVLSLSLTIGILQWLKLKNWNIKAFPWLLATTLGSAIAFPVPSWLIGLPFLSSTTDQYMLMVLARLVLALIALIIGACIGSAQAIVLRRFNSRPGLWILANSFGFLALVFLAALVLTFGFTLGKRLLPILEQSAFGSDIVQYRDFVLGFFVLMTLPFLSTLTIALPTGIIISKYSDRREENKGE
jgi:hypothetical protein